MRHITLPNERTESNVIVVKGKITEDMVQDKYPARCPRCSNDKFKIFNKVFDDKVGIVQFKCQSCFYNLDLIFSHWKLGTHNCIVIMKSKIPEFESREREISSAHCKFCGGSLKTIHRFENEFLTPHVVMCEKCKKKMIVEYQRLYYVPYKHLMSLANKVIDKTPELVFVLCASAFEIYCKYAIEHHSMLTKSLIDKRRLNFQDLNLAKSVFKDGFKIDIVKLNETKWNDVTGIFRNRHDIIHNGGFDKDGNLITCTKNEAQNAIECINQRVELIEKEFVKDEKDRNGN